MRKERVKQLLPILTAWVDGPLRNDHRGHVQRFLVLAHPTGTKNSSVVHGRRAARMDSVQARVYLIPKGQMVDRSD